MSSVLFLHIYIHCINQNEVFKLYCAVRPQKTRLEPAVNNVQEKNTSRNFATFDQELCDFNFTKEPLSIPSWQFPGILKHKPNQRLDKVWPKYIESIHIDCSRDKMMKYDGKVMKRVMKRNEILKLPIKMCELISSLKHWKLSFKDRMISSKKQLEKHSRCLLKVWQKDN